MVVPEYTFDEPVAVIGDIHGCADALRSLLRLIGKRPVLVVGDVIDRGPDSRSVLDILIERGARGVRGNHEEWLLRFFASGDLPPIVLAPHIGGAATLDSYGIGGSIEEMREQRSRIPEHHVAWLESLPLVAGLSIDSERFWLIHAGVDASALEALPAGARVEDIVPWLAERNSSSLLWGSVPPSETMPLDRPTIMGHMSVRRPVFLPHVIGIDTGAGTHTWGMLSAFLLPERRVVGVPAAAPG